MTLILSSHIGRRNCVFGFWSDLSGRSIILRMSEMFYYLKSMYQNLLLSLSFMANSVFNAIFSPLLS